MADELTRYMLFTQEEINHMKAILIAKEAVLHQVTHCLWRIRRFAHQAQQGRPFRAAQWGLNLGRAQELLGSTGGTICWWGTCEPALEAHDWQRLNDRAKTT